MEDLNEAEIAILRSKLMVIEPNDCRGPGPMATCLGLVSRGLMEIHDVQTHPQPWVKQRYTVKAASINLAGALALRKAEAARDGAINEPKAD